MGNNKMPYGIGLLVLVISVAAALRGVSAHDQPPVEVIYKGCCDDCHKNCTAHGESAAECEKKCSMAKCDNVNTKGAVVVEVVVQGSGSSSGSASGSSSSNSGSSSTATQAIGSTSGESKSAGSASGEAKAEGSASGEAKAGGPASGEATTSGSASGEAKAGGSGAGESKTEGSASGETKAGGSASGEAKAGGSASGEAKAEGSASGEAKAEGSASGEAKAGGSGAGEAKAEGSGAGESKAGGSGAGEAKAEGSGAGESKAEGSASGGAKAEGSASGEAKAEGSASGEAKAEGSASGEAKAEGSASGESKVEGSASGEAKAEGSASGEAKAEGSATGSSTTGVSKTGGVTNDVTAAGGSTADRSTTSKSVISGTLTETIKGLCQKAMYKDACMVLVNLAGGKASTEELIKSAVSLVIEGYTKVSSLVVEKLETMVASAKKPETAKLAVGDCKCMFDFVIEKLNLFISELINEQSFTIPCAEFRFRLWLSDVVTLASSCLDNLVEAEAPELENVIKGGVTNSSEVTMSILDIFTSLTIDFRLNLSAGLNATGITNALVKFGIISKKEQKVGTARRLLGGPSEMLGNDGLPRWLSETDRRLLNADNEPQNAPVTPNAVVAQDGSGNFKTIAEALEAYDPKKIDLPPGAKYVIYVKAGIYDEYILIPSKKANIFIYGDGPTKTIVTGNKSFKGGVPTSKTATFAIQAPNFFAKDMAFENTAGCDGHQAVALRCNNEQQVFLNCHFNGNQDTLYPQGGSQFFRDCLISGTVDFIFGNGATVIQHSTIVVRMPLLNQFNALTAQGRTGPSMPTGLVLQDCTVVADPALDKAKIQTYLGRPWKTYARTVFMENDLGDLITPDGYRPFEGTGNTEESFYGEYANIGPSAATNARVKWPGIKVLTKEEAQPFTVGAFLPGGDAWLNAAHAPYYPGFKAP